LQQIVVLCPAASGILGVKAPTTKQFLSQASNVVRLAVSPRFRGSGPAVEKARALQKTAVAFVAKAALSRQKIGLDRWLDKSGHVARDGDGEQDLPGVVYRGFSFMWDEASQINQVAETKVHERPSRWASFRGLSLHLLGCCWCWWRGQCPMAALALPSHVLGIDETRVLVGSPSQSAALDFDVHEAMQKFCKDSAFTIICFAFDMASSNVTGCGKIHGAVSNHNFPGLALHAERCLTHQLHIVKAACLSLSHIAPMMYSLSRIIAKDASLRGLEGATRINIRNNLLVRYSPDDPPKQQDLFDIVMYVCGIDGDTDMIAASSKRKRVVTNFLSDVRRLCERCHYDRIAKKSLD
jgi:hypothetical protein